MLLYFFLCTSASFLSCQGVFVEKDAFLSSFLVLTYNGSAFYIFMYIVKAYQDVLAGKAAIGYSFLSTFLVFGFNFSVRAVCLMKRVCCQ